MCVSGQDWPRNMYLGRICTGICVYLGRICPGMCVYLGRIGPGICVWVGLAQEYVSGQDWPRNMCVSG